MQKPQPDFDNRLRKALLCQGEPDRVPLAELMVDPVVMEQFMGKPCWEPKLRDRLPDYLEFWCTAGYDYVKLSPSVNLNPAGIKPKEGARISAENDTGRERAWAPEGTGFITSMQEFESFQWPNLNEIDYSVFERVQPLLPDGMKIIGQYGDIFTFAWEFMGFEQFSYALVEQPELVEALINKLGEIEYAMFATMAEVPNIGALWYSDDIAYTEGLLVAPSVLRKYLFPWMKKIGDLCKKRNIPFIYHTDGVLWEVMDDLIDCGINALHPIEPKAMDIVEVKQRLAGKVAVIGNIDLGYTLTRGTPEEVAAEVKQRIKDVAPGGGYALGSSNTVPNYVPVQNYRAMVETCREFGKYPIQL
ncbi:MAG: nucleoside 2-deoxyribosyltransferase [bacterium]|nr:nucleoside 2-deoxyribosyltransferase [bacterium]